MFMIFPFLSPCPASGIMIYGKKDELVPVEYLNELNKRLSSQKGIKVEFESVPDANHFFSKAGESIVKSLNKYIKKRVSSLLKIFNYYSTSARPTYSSSKRKRNRQFKIRSNSKISKGLRLYKVSVNTIIIN